jgi:hypothetical protein
MPATSALWITHPGAVAFRDAPLPPAGEGDVVVEAGWSGISRGTEALVLRGGVPVSERRRMRAPFQAGDFLGRSSAATDFVWDAGAGPGDRIAVVGGGTAAGLAAWLCRRLETAFADLASAYGRILDDPGTLCHRVRHR